MSFELYVDGKPKGQMTSMGGMETLTQAYADRGTELGRFLTFGYSKKLAQLRTAIETVLSQEPIDPFDPNIPTLKALLRKLPEKGTVSIASD